MIKQLSILAFGVISSLSLAAPPDVDYLLTKMIKAAKGLDYHATLVLQDGDKITSIAVEHISNNNGKRELERLVSLQGSRQELILDGNRMLVLLPNGKHDMVLRNPLADTFLNLYHLRAKYDISFIGHDRVADRKANVLYVKARDQYHYSYKLWLDKKTGIYLRGQWLDNKNNKISEAMFASIKFGQNSQLAHSLGNSVTKKITIDKLPKLVMPYNIKIGWLPDGFNLINKITHSNNDKSKLEHLVFGDGMIKVSVYINKSDQFDISGFLDMGRTNFYGRNLQDKHLTVLGELPPAAVKRIAESIEYKK